MRVLPLVCALSVLALPARDILGLLGPDSGTPAVTPAVSHDPTRTPKPSTSSASPARTTTTLSTTTPSAEQTTTAINTAVATTVSPTSSVLPAPTTADSPSKTWQIVGIAIIAVLFIATAIACAMFFDRLWRFLKDVVCCTSQPSVSEEFIPDCENHTPSHSDPLYTGASLHTMQARELPWNSDIQDWNTLHRQPFRRNDPPAA